PSSCPVSASPAASHSSRAQPTHRTGTGQAHWAASAGPASSPMCRVGRPQALVDHLDHDAAEARLVGVAGDAVDPAGVAGVTLAAVGKLRAVAAGTVGVVED